MVPKKLLIHQLAISRVRVAGPQKGRRGQVRSEEAELAITTSFLRRTLSVVGVRAHAMLLLGRLEVIGPGAGAAAGRRNYSLNLERIWANQRRADQLSRLQGKSLLRRGHFKTDWIQTKTKHSSKREINKSWKSIELSQIQKEIQQMIPHTLQFAKKMQFITDSIWKYVCNFVLFVLCCMSLSFNKCFICEKAHSCDKIWFSTKVRIWNKMT